MFYYSRSLNQNCFRITFSSRFRGTGVGSKWVRIWGWQNLSFGLRHWTVLRSNKLAGTVLRRIRGKIVFGIRINILPRKDGQRHMSIDRIGIRRTGRSENATGWIECIPCLVSKFFKSMIDNSNLEWDKCELKNTQSATCSFSSEHSLKYGNQRMHLMSLVWPNLRREIDHVIPGNLIGMTGLKMSYRTLVCM